MGASMSRLLVQTIFLLFLLLAVIVITTATSHQLPREVQIPPIGPGGIWESNLSPFQLPYGVTASSPNQYTITGPRPLLSAAELLSQVLAVPVSYEDAAWAADSDIELANIVVSAPAAILPPSVFPRPLVPRVHTFSFTLAPFSELRKGAAEPVIQSVIDSYHRSGSPGKFKVIGFGAGEFSIVAVSVADAAGKDTNQESPLDKRITMTARGRSLWEAMGEIRNQVSSGSAVLTIDASAGVVSGTGYGNYLNNNRTDIGAANESARDILSKILRSQGSGTARFAWTMTFIPRSKNATLFLYDVRAEISHPDGSKWLAPVVWPVQMVSPKD
jgi:hypothetical protein